MKACVNLMETKMKYPCTGKYVEANLQFGHNPELGTLVTQRGGTSGNTVGKVITFKDFCIIEHINDSVSSIAIKAFAVSVDPAITGANRRFAEDGNSGSLVTEYTNPEKPKVYGMV